jgi:TonB family protein
VRAGETGPGMAFGLLAISAAAHLIAFSLLQLLPPIADNAQRTVTVDVLELQSVPPAAQALAASAPSPLPARPAPAAAPAPRVRRAPAPPAPAPPVAPQTPELTGSTLTGADPSAWTTAVGNDEPLGLPRQATTVAQSRASAERRDQAPSVVPSGSLSRQPRAPSGLDGLLQRYYPRRARSQGVAGEVVVRMRVLPNGDLSEIRVLKERPPGFDFASACRQMLLQAPAFVPPLDRRGQRVASDVPFRCSFEVDD